MSTLSKEQLIERLKPVLKLQGFRKTKATWRKSTDDLVFVLNIQGSQWSKEDYYINVGIYIKALGSDENPTANVCHIQSRISTNQTFESIFQDVIDWFEIHGDIAKLKELKQQNNLPLMTMVMAIEYLDEV
jgi:hypothetical protein